MEEYEKDLVKSKDITLRGKFEFFLRQNEEESITPQSKTAASPCSEVIELEFPSCTSSPEGRDVQVENDAKKSSWLSCFRAHKKKGAATRAEPETQTPDRSSSEGVSSLPLSIRTSQENHLSPRTTSPSTKASSNETSPPNRSSAGIIKKTNPVVSIDFIKEIAKWMSDLIATTKLRALEEDGGKRSLLDCSSWSDQDDAIVNEIRTYIGNKDDKDLPNLPSYSHSVNTCRHVITAAILRSVDINYSTDMSRVDDSFRPMDDWNDSVPGTEFLTDQGNIEVIFSNMKSYLIQADKRFFANMPDIDTFSQLTDDSHSTTLSSPNFSQDTTQV